VYARPVKSMAALAIIALCLAACPPASTSNEGSPQKPASACTKEGQNCEFSPGKIGLCIAKAGGCDGGLCLSCMSLH
jgi:hypothetical protein